MLDLRLIREDPDLVRGRLRRRDDSESLERVERVLELDQDRRALLVEVDQLRARRNEVSPRVGELKRLGRDDEAETLVAEMRGVGERIAAVEVRLSEVEEGLRENLLRIPNLPAEEVPAGGEAENVVVREWGETPAVDFEPRPHWELGEALQILDLPRGAKIAGSGFPLLVARGARLERALINFMIHLHVRGHG
jgi:seryl-tRNA synthetase